MSPIGASTRALFSVVIPTYRRPKQLARCLEALASLDYPHDDFEVIVVDDGSADPPSAEVAAFRGLLDITLIPQPHSGPATARNTGAALARGRFLAFIDDDCAPAPTYLSRLADRFAAGPDRAVGGLTLNSLTAKLYSTASQMLVHYLYDYYNAVPEQARFFASNNLAVPADRFRAIGGFDSDFTQATAEDREFCARWLHNGYRMTYAPEIIVYHAHALTLAGFWRQHFRYGYGAFHFHRARAQKASSRIKVEPLAFYLGMLRYPFLHARSSQPVLLATLMIVSQLANAAGFVCEAAGRLAASGAATRGW